MSQWQPGYDPRQQQPQTPPQWQQRGYPPSVPPLQGMPPTAVQSGQPQWQQPQYQPPGYAPQYQPPRPPQRRRHTARNVIAAMGALAAVIIVISAAGGSGHSVQATGSTAAAGARGGTQKAAGTGSAITLAGNSSGEQVSVTVTKVISGASPGDSFSGAPSGDRLYAVQFRLSDTGSAAYSDAPSNGAAVIDSAGQSYRPGLETVTGCQGFGGTENIAPGNSGLGCIVFEVPESAKITQVQFTLDSGMGPGTGQWDVASG